MRLLDAYEQIRQEELGDIHSTGYLLRHKKTGARICLISNEDSNKVFCIGFRTPSQNSTGMAHIVEHTVLCGSKHFPVKDPFVELVKGSLNTFLNAMTYPDKTVYPIASVNDADFQNLMHVYMDAVFYPNIYRYEEIFKQEGWHYELESEEDPLMINGVVYNEMKGAFSSAEDVLDRQILASLYPDVSYRYESGGDPAEIPKLSYEAFLDFHRRFYHPSNSYIYLYGDMDMEEKLDWLDREYLGKFDYLSIDSAIQRQEPFRAPRELTKPYPVASTDPVAENTYLSVSYSIGTMEDERLYNAFDLLSYVLLQAPGAPVKQALLDAGIGKDISGSYNTDLYQPYFSIVAKNSDPERKEEFLAVIRESLTKLVENGLNKKTLLAAINSSEFKWREADFGSYPKGLMYGLMSMESWIYDDDAPFQHFHTLDCIEWMKSQVETGYFENLIKTYLLDNPHQSVVVITPERGLNEKREEELAEQLEQYKQSLSQEEIRQLIADTQALEEYQDTPSTQEELETIPLLGREDMKKEAEPFSNEERRIADSRVLFHDVETNGIVYADFLFDLADVSAEDVPYVGLLVTILGLVDTQHYSYTELTDEINLYTGGITDTIGIYSDVRKDEIVAKLEMRLKVLPQNMEKGCELVTEIINSSKFTDFRRIREILAQEKSRLQMGLSSAGHTVSATRAMAGFSKAACYSDATSGIAYYRVVSRMEEAFEEEKEAFTKKLQTLAEQIFCRENLIMDLGCRNEEYENLKETLSGFLSGLQEKKSASTGKPLVCVKRKEGFYDASQVQYVSRTGNFKKAGFAYTGVLRVLKVILGYEYLWMNIRVKGGAYGCMSGFNRNGDSYFSSYRDPNLAETNEVYENIPAYLREFEIEERDMTKYIIGAFSDMDTPLTPSARISRSRIAVLTGITYEQVQRERDEVLAATQEDIRALADLVEAVLSEQALCVIGNEKKLKKNAKLFDHLEALYEGAVE